jgi:S1-C subfamily serine protease
MSKEQFSLHNLGPLLLLAAVAIMGAVFWFSPAISAGTRATSEPQTRIAYADARTPSPNIGMGYAAILKPALSAVVNISSSKVVKIEGQPFEFFNDPFFQKFFGDQFQQLGKPRAERERSLGSGVIVRPNGYILTNNHVIEGAT